MKTFTHLEHLVEMYGLQWSEFRDALDDMDREVFRSLIERVKQNATAVSKIQNCDMFESVIMSILVEHQKELQELETRLLKPQTKTCPRCGKTTRIEEFYKGSTLQEGGYYPVSRLS